MVILDLRGLTFFTDYFMVCSADSTLGVRKLAESIIETLEAQEAPPLHAEGMEQGKWVLLDYGSFIVHIFLEEVRDFYDLEGLWGDAREVDWGH